MAFRGECFIISSTKQCFSPNNFLSKKQVRQITITCNVTCGGKELETFRYFSFSGTTTGLI